MELYQRCLIWNVTDEPPDNGDHQFSGLPDVPWTIIWPETFRECYFFTWCNFFLVEWDSENIIVRAMVLTILNEAIILSAICEEKTSKSESYPWILKLSLEQNPTTGTGPRSDCQCASGIPPREHSTLDQTSSISSWYQATAAKEDSIKLIPACGLIDGTISMRYHQPKIASSRSGTMFTVKTFLSLLLGAVTAQIGENHLLHLQKNSTAQDRVSLILLCKHKPSYFYSHFFRSNGPTRHWRVHPRSWAVQPRGEDTTWPVVQPALILFLGLGLFSSIRSSPENLLPDRAETRSSQVREAACLWSKVRFWILFGLKRKLISGIRSEVSLGEQQEERWGWRERRRNEGYKIWKLVRIIKRFYYGAFFSFPLFIPQKCKVWPI